MDPTGPMLRLNRGCAHEGLPQIVFKKENSFLKEQSLGSSPFGLR